MQKDLPDKYRKALTLLKEGDLSYREIAKQSGIPEATFYDLIEGNTEQYGAPGAAFHTELEKIEKQIDKEIRQSLRDCKKRTYYLINDYLSKQKSASKGKMATLVAVANALAKSTPKVEIGSFSYTQGLTAQEVAYEFKRLNAGSREIRSDGGAILEALGGGSTEIPLGEARIPQDGQESEDTSLQAEPETRPLPPIPGER